MGLQLTEQMLIIPVSPAYYEVINNMIHASSIGSKKKALYHKISCPLLKIIGVDRLRVEM